jgi:hypothetical protein
MNTQVRAHHHNDRQADAGRGDRPVPLATHLPSLLERTQRDSKVLTPGEAIPPGKR